MLKNTPKGEGGICPLLQANLREPRWHYVIAHTIIASQWEPAASHRVQATVIRAAEGEVAPDAVEGPIRARA